MDEATANVDFETDLLIQEAIKEGITIINILFDTIRSFSYSIGFKNSTVLTIAHRINTIMHYDRVLVLNLGKVAEYDQPSNLLKDKTTIFSSLAAEAGIV